MARAAAVELAKVLDVVERDGGLADDLVLRIDREHSRQMQHRIKQHRGMPGGQHEAIAIRPDGIFRIEPQKPLPQAIYDRRHRHRSARMARVGLLNSHDRESAESVDAEVINRRVRHGNHLLSTYCGGTPGRQATRAHRHRCRATPKGYTSGRATAAARSTHLSSAL